MDLVYFIVVVVLVSESVHNKKKHKLIIGIPCIVFAVKMYVSPLIRILYLLPISTPIITLLNIIFM